MCLCVCVSVCRFCDCHANDGAFTLPTGPVCDGQVKKFGVLQRIVGAQDDYIRELEVRCGVACLCVCVVLVLALTYDLCTCGVQERNAQLAAAPKSSVPSKSDDVRQVLWTCVFGLVEDRLCRPSCFTVALPIRCPLPTPRRSRPSSPRPLNLSGCTRKTNGAPDARTHPLLSLSLCVGQPSS